MSERTKVYNPRWRRWDWADTGEPVEPRPVPLAIDEKHVQRWAETGLMFGEFEGLPLAQVPADSLREIRTNNVNLAEAIRRELAGRPQL